MSVVSLRSKNSKLPLFEVANRNLTLQNLFFLEEIVKFNSQSECGFFGFVVKKSKEKSTDWAERSTRFLLIVC